MTYGFRIDDAFWSEMSSRMHEFECSWPRINFSNPDDRSPLHSPPEIRVLSELVSEAYWASLEQEEQIYNPFSILLITDYTAHENVGPDNYYLAQPIRYETHAIKKLAPAVGELNAAFLVRQNASDLYIEGITLAGRNLGQVNIKVIDPGCLIIGYWHEPLALLERGTACFIRDPEFAQSLAIWKKFPLENKDFYERLGTDHVENDETTVRFVLDTLREIRRIKRGGTVIFVTSLEGLSASIESNIYSARSSTDSPQEKMFEYPNSVKLDKFARRIARFTSVDGATLMSMDLNVLAFGVKLTSPKTTNFSIDTIDALGEIERAVTIDVQHCGGKRHQSAARFVYDNPETVAFVISEDGEITCFTWRHRNGSGSLYAYKRLELLLF